MARAQVVEPLLQRGRRHLVELVYADEKVLGEDLFGCLHLDDIFLLCCNLQRVAGMYALEGSLPVVEVVSTLAEVEVEDADAIDLLYLVVLVAELYVLGD